MCADVKRSRKHKINVVLYWHMHQPEYRDLRNGEYCLPWTYLHTIKDYVDMAAHLEAVPAARAVVNFAPVLLEQINDYAQQLDDYLNRGLLIKDPLLRALADPVQSKNDHKRLGLISDCLRANEERLINRFEPYKQIARMARAILKTPETLAYFDDQFLADLLMWYHLAWIGETVRRQDIRIKALMKKARLFSIQDRRLLLEIMAEMISGVIERYRLLAEQGRVELSMTPYAHPIVPLLLDIESSQQAIPDIPLPRVREYPDGVNRSHWHMKKGFEIFHQCFGFYPAGCWPSEGSISEETIKLVSEHDIQWLASGDTVLRNSLAKSKQSDGGCIHTAYRYDNQPAVCFFRDDGLSDLIGFKYSTWHADDAVANLIDGIESIGDACGDHPDTIVSIILDGENAWEYYPENGYYFLNALYQQLSVHDSIRMTTYSEYLKGQPEIMTINKIVAGSWVYGTFSTWIGDHDKNMAWDMLAEAKHVYDQVISEGTLDSEQQQRAELQLAICEGSDWFWWFGDYNAAESVASFDEQYRMHLCNLYCLLGKQPPEYLSHAFSHGSGSPTTMGTMLPGRQG